MSEATQPIAVQAVASKAVLDDAPTVCAIAIVATIFSTMLHEGVGHALTSIVTLHASGTLTSLAWVSAKDSRLVDAGGTLVNLITALIFWLLLRFVRRARPSMRFFFLIATAFNLLAGTGYFFYSGVCNFGDWAQVIAGLPHHAWLRAGLVALGVISYYGAILLVGSSLVRHMSVSLSDAPRFRRLLWLPYFSAVGISVIAGVLNPIGWQYVFLSALAATGGGYSGLLWLRYYLPKHLQPGPDNRLVLRSYAWMVVAAAFAVAFIVVFGPGIHLQG